MGGPQASIEENGDLILALSAGLSGAPDTAATARRLVEAVGPLAGGSRAAVLQWSEETASASVLATSGFTPGRAAFLEGMTLPVAGRSAASLFEPPGVSGHRPGAGSGDLLLDRLVEHPQEALVYAAPIAVDGQIIGSLVAIEEAGSRSERISHSRLTALAAHASLAFRNARLLEQQRTSLEMSRAESAVLQAIARGESPTAVLPHVARMVEGAVDGRCAIMLVEAEKRTLRVAAAPSLSPSFTSLLDMLPVLTPSGPSGAAVDSGRTTVIHDLATDDLHDDVAKAAVKDGLRACISTPIVASADARVVGTIDLYHGAPHEPTAEERSVLERASCLASIALERAALQEELAHVSLHDALTGLPNRLVFKDRIEHALARTDRDPEPLAVLFLDIDNFKSVNDSFGHDAGDEMLAGVAHRLRSLLRPGDTATRLGSDEFALLLEDTPAAGADAVATRILASLAEPFSVRGANVCITGSIGIVLGRAGEVGVDDILRRADVAVHAAKRDGKACFRTFDDGLHASVFERLAIEDDLRGAVERQELTVEYQPVVSFHTDRVVEMEALVRWNHPTRGLISPGDFIPIAEETGVIGTIGSWVLKRSLRQLQTWRRDIPHAAPRRIAVNLSPGQVARDDIVSEVEAALAESGVDGSDVTLEITETVLMEDNHSAKQKLTALRDLGVRIAVDDFGSGYSSLSYLKQFPIDILKIDRGLIADIDGPPEDSALPHAIVKLGQSLNLRVVAEGIERREQLDRLVDLGCDSGQGYFFSKPLSAPAAEEFLVRATSAKDDRAAVFVAPRS